MPADNLAKFQEFLIKEKGVPDKNAPYYVLWVNNFFSFSERNVEEKFDQALKRFLEHLPSQKTGQWQLQQAEQAVKLYFQEFLKGDSAQILLRLRKAIRLKHYSYSTERTYLDWTERFFAYLTGIKKNTIQISNLCSGQVKEYLSYLAVQKRVSSSTQNQAFNALLFLFRGVLNIELKDLDKTVRAKRGPKLPVVLSAEEVQKLFNQMENRTLLMAELLYGGGFRLMELVRLRVQDIDFDHGLIFVRSAKQDKDRSTILPESLKEQLKLHLGEVKKIHEKDLFLGYGEVYLPDALGNKYPAAAKEWGWQYVFPANKLSVDPRSGKIRRHHIDPSSLQKAVRSGLRKAGIIKNASVHTLRHCFATHLLMNGVNIREVQELLGHKNVETTMVYTHVLRDVSAVPKSPLDSLKEKKYALQR